jgi:cytochrome P450
LPRALQAWRFYRRPDRTLEACRRRLGDLFELTIAPIGRVVVVADPDAIKTILAGDPVIFHAGEANGQILPLLAERSLLLADEDAHLRQRRRLLPAFHGDRLRASAALIERIANEHVSRWPRDEPFPLLPRTRALAFEIIASIVIGLRGPSEIAALQDALARTLRPSALLARSRSLNRMGPLGPRAALARHREALDSLLIAQIKRRRLRPDAGHDDVLGQLLLSQGADDGLLSDRYLCDELRALLLVGHETTASALAWAFDLILHHVEVEQRLRADPDDDRYLDAVINESLRLRPPVVDVVRRLNRPLRLCGLQLQAGTSLMIAPLLVHHDERLYPDPATFRPERFFDRADAHAFVPFGGGVRRCLGAALALQEMRVVIPLVVRSLALRPARGDLEEMRLYGTTLIPRHGTVVICDGHLARPATGGEPARPMS